MQNKYPEFPAAFAGIKVFIQSVKAFYLPPEPAGLIFPVLKKMANAFFSVTRTDAKHLPQISAHYSAMVQ
jgi:hypothetical protein